MPCFPINFSIYQLFDIFFDKDAGFPLPSASYTMKNIGIQIWNSSNMTRKMLRGLWGWGHAKYDLANLLKTPVSSSTVSWSPSDLPQT